MPLKYSVSCHPELLFHYILLKMHTHLVFYRPALLNGRHIVDVVRAVCGPADVSEAELDRVRREATERAKERNHETGVWRTWWRGAVVIV